LRRMRARTISSSVTSFAADGSSPKPLHVVELYNARVSFVSNQECVSGASYALTAISSLRPEPLLALCYRCGSGIDVLDERLQTARWLRTPKTRLILRRRSPFVKLENFHRACPQLFHRRLQ
jgi:hypothetical protein